MILIGIIFQVAGAKFWPHGLVQELGILIFGIGWGILFSKIILSET